MLKFVVFACFSVILCSAIVRDYKEANPIDANSDWDLVFVQQLWRHGDRSPITQFLIPNDLLTADDWVRGGGGYGQLSPRGMSQHLTLGFKLRDRYDGFVSPRYVANEVYIRSTDVNRTLISAVSNLLGFYQTVNATPNEDYPTVPGWPRGYVPVPIHTVPEHWDPVLGVHNCPREKKAFNALRETKEWKTTIDKHKDLLATVERLGGFKNFTLQQIGGVRDTLFIEKSSPISNFTMPAGFDEDLFTQIDELSGIVDDLEDGINVAEANGFNFKIELPKLTGGPLLWEMIGNMQQKRACLDKTSGRTVEEQRSCAYFDTLKYYAFSAHDSTISSLFSTFGFPESNFNTTGLPHYASCVSIEMYRSPDGKNYNVTVLYWPELHGPYEVTHWVDGCDQLDCSLEKFINRSLPYRIDDMEKYCKSCAFGLNLTIASLLVALAAMLFDWTSRRA